MHQRLRILFTSDVHGAVFAHSYANGAPVSGSFERLSTLISELRDDMSVVIDGGDTIEGSPLTSFHERNKRPGPSPASRALAHIGYDYVVPGNHDFSYGPASFEQHLSACGAELLCCNIERKHPGATSAKTDIQTGHEAASASKPQRLLGYVVGTYANKRIAFIGATTHFVPRWEPAAHTEPYEFFSAFDCVKTQVDELRQNDLADYIVVVYHGGFERDLLDGSACGIDNGENQAWRMLREIEGIDLLLTGHTHLPICQTVTGADGRLVCCIQPGTKGAYLACVDLNLEDLSLDARLLEVTADCDPALSQLIAEDEQACQHWLDEPLGSSLMDLRVEDGLKAKIDKAPLVSFLNLVQLEASSAQLSGTALFTGATGFGEIITMRDLVVSYPFSNTLVVKRVSGAQLRAYLEKCAEFFATDGSSIVVAPDFADPPKDFNYDMVDGIDYTIDVSRERGSRITSLNYQGLPVSDTSSFTLCVNNYRASGGGDFAMIAEAEVVSENLTDMVELIADYISRHSPISFEHHHNIRVLATSLQQ